MGATWRCDACGVSLPYGVPRARIGDREFCPPDGSPCHTLGQRSASWRFTRAEGAELLAADAGRLLPLTGRPSRARNVAA